MSKIINTLRFKPLLILLLLCLSNQHQAANSTASALMSSAMLSMMDAMGNLAQQYNRNKNWTYGSSYQPFNNWSTLNTAPWTGYTLPGMGVPGQQQIQGLSSNTIPSQLPPTQAVPGSVAMIPPQSPLDGIWQGQGGEIVLVMYGHFRIYADADTYRDGRYQVREDRIIMQDPGTGAERSYEFAHSEGRMVLRSEDGTILLFRQLPIPVPPYSIFSGQSTSLPDQQAPTDKKKQDSEDLPQ